jgi:hypothetical protein
MRERRRRPCFAPQPVQIGSVGGQRISEGFERNRPAQARVIGQIHTPHAPAPDFANNDVLTYVVAGLKPACRIELLGIREQVHDRSTDGLTEKRTSPAMVLQQSQHFITDFGVIRRFVLKPNPDIGRLVLERGFEQDANA